jgi:hypothetical protein
MVDEVEAIRRSLPKGLNKATRKELKGEKRIAPAIRASREYGVGQMKGAGAGAAAATLAQMLAEPVLEETLRYPIEKAVDEEGNVDTKFIERGRIKPKLRGYKGPESEMKSGGKVAYKAKGGKVAPRGCGVAMRGYGKAMKGK